MTTFEEFKGSRHWHLNRPNDPTCADVPLVRVKIVHGNGTLDLDLNELFMAAATGDLARLQPAEGITSVVTNDPGVLFRTPEAQIGLSPAEADRLAAHSLSPEEFFAICDAVGCIWLTHDDFYDPETGEALQPMMASVG